MNSTTWTFSFAFISIVFFIAPAQELSKLHVLRTEGDTLWFRRMVTLSFPSPYDELRFWESEYWLKNTQIFSDGMLYTEPINSSNYYHVVIVDLTERPRLSLFPTGHFSPNEQQAGVSIEYTKIPYTLSGQLYLQDFKNPAFIGKADGFSFLPFFLTASAYFHIDKKTQYATLTLRRPIERSDITIGTDVRLKILRNYKPLEIIENPISKVAASVTLHWDVGERIPLYFSIAGTYQRTIDQIPAVLYSALDNTAGYLISITSLSQQYSEFQYLSDFTPVLPVGASGTVLFGQFFALDTNAQPFLYLGGRAEKGTWIKNKQIYFHALLQAGSGFHKEFAYYTFLESSAQLVFIQGPMSFHLWSEQQTRWNWPAFSRLFLDEHHHLRGYPAQTATGENRFVLSAEIHYQLQPIFIFHPSFAFFADFGSVWNQGQQFFSLPFFSSIGFGFHIPYRLFAIQKFLRIDAGYAPRNHQFFIEISSALPFPPLGNVQPPEITIFGTNYDVQPFP